MGEANEMSFSEVMRKNTRMRKGVEVRCDDGEMEK